MTIEEITDALALTKRQTFDGSPGTVEWQAKFFRRSTVTLLSEVTRLQAKLDVIAEMFSKETDARGDNQ